MLRRGLLALLFAAAFGGRADAQMASDHYAVLMVWMPGLCVLEPTRPECKGLTLRRYDGQNLAFMALEVARDSGVSQTFCYTMPSDFELNQSRDWCDMSKPNASSKFDAQLQQLMPIVQSCQDRGLWARYASCTMYSPDDYYERAFRLAKGIAGTLVNLKIAGAIGQTASQQALVAAFEQQFGDDTGTAIDFICRKVDGKSHLINVKLTVTVRALTRGLSKETLWRPSQPMRRSCPENMIVDGPPGTQLGAAAPAAKAATPPPPPPKPRGPDVPPAVPVEPVETAPLSPPDRPKVIPFPGTESR